MKKSTGIIFLLAVALAAFVYFYDLKHTPPSETPGDTSKPAFSAVNADDISGLTLDRAGTTVVFDRRKDDWYIEQLGIHHPQQIEFDRLNITYTLLSKRKLLTLVQEWRARL